MKKITLIFIFLIALGAVFLYWQGNQSKAIPPKVLKEKTEVTGRLVDLPEPVGLEGGDSETQGLAGDDGKPYYLEFGTTLHTYERNERFDRWYGANYGEIVMVKGKLSVSKTEDGQEIYYLDCNEARGPGEIKLFER